MGGLASGADPSSHKGQENVTKMLKPTHEMQPGEEHCVSKNSSQGGRTLGPEGLLQAASGGSGRTLMHPRHLLWESWWPPAAFQGRGSLLRRTCFLLELCTFRVSWKAQDGGGRLSCLPPLPSPPSTLFSKWS